MESCCIVLAIELPVQGLRDRRNGVLRIVVSSDSMKKATVTSHGRRFLEAAEGDGEVPTSATDATSVLFVLTLAIPF